MKKPKNIDLKSFRYGLFVAAHLRLDEVQIHSTYYEEYDVFNHIKEKLNYLIELAEQKKENENWLIKKYLEDEK